MLQPQKPPQPVVKLQFAVSNRFLMNPTGVELVILKLAVCLFASSVYIDCFRVTI